MDDFSDNVMKTIFSINDYVNKNGNKTVIDKYYQTYGTYRGIIKYLNVIEKNVNDMSRSEEI